MLLVAPLLGHLDDNHSFGAAEAKPRIFGDDPSGTMLVDHLIAVTCGRGENLEHHILDGIGEGTQLIVAAAHDEIDTDKGHSDLH